MKTASQNKNRVLFLISCIAIIFTVFQSANAYPEEARPGEAKAGVNVSFETFYHELAPYGRWVNDRDFGRVWIPDVPRGFHPYVTEGYWVMTDYGNTWVSDYSWGWAPFHYGRWHFDDYYGWVWIPDTEWGPAWVAWRSGGGYYGWAPLGPRVNINISVNIGRHIPDAHWSFVKYGHFTHRNVYRYCAPRPRVTNIIHHTTIINNTYVDNGRHIYYTGPEVRDIERATRKRVRVHNINQVDRPGTTVVRDGSVNVYRPSGRSSRVDYDANNRSSRTSESRTSHSNVSDDRRNAASRAREQYTNGTNSRQSLDNRDTRSTRSYPSRSSRDDTRVNRASESRRESSFQRDNNMRSQADHSNQLQRSSRSSTPQRYSQGTRENTTRRSTQSRSSTVERSSRTGNSGQSTRPSRGNATYQRESRSSSSGARSSSSRGTERSSNSQNRSSRSSRSGGN